VLDESPKLIGIAQMALLLPSTLLILIGGSLTDRFGSKRQVVLAQGFAMLAPLFLLILLLTSELTYFAMILFGIISGTAHAFATPARDGLLNLVARGKVQRLVALGMLMQFGGQIIGIGLAGFAETRGAIGILTAQIGVLGLGVFAFSKVDTRMHTSPILSSNKNLLHSLTEGYRSVVTNPAMLAVLFQNVAMGVFFMGSYVVTLPILIREIYAGSSADIALINATNSFGLVFTIGLLLRLNTIHRQGRALLVTQALGCFALAIPGLILGFRWLVISIFCWGALGGIGMTMSKTIMQEQAPSDQRGRVMAFYSFSLLGAMPFGALFCGYLVDEFGAPNALIIASTLMLVCAALVTSFSKLWHFDTRSVKIGIV